MALAPGDWDRMKRAAAAIAKALAIGICVASMGAAPTGAWQVDDTISPLDGSRTYAAILRSDNTIRSAAGTNERATLVVRCRSGRLDAFIAWSTALGTGPLEMRWKADAGDTYTEVWSVSVDGGSTFSEGPRALLTQIAKASRMTFQVSLPNFDSLQASFTVSGSDQIAKDALSACPG